MAVTRLQRGDNKTSESDPVLETVASFVTGQQSKDFAFTAEGKMFSNRSLCGLNIHRHHSFNCSLVL